MCLQVALARAAYGTEDILLLDDPLSALDVKSTKHVFKKLIKGFLGIKTVLLATHNTTHLQDMDYIVCLEQDGLVSHIAHQGTWNELSDKGVVSLSNGEDQDAVPTTEPGAIIPPATAIAATQRDTTETKKTGSVSKRVQFMFWSLGFGVITLPLIVLLGAGTEATKVAQEQLLLEWHALMLYNIFQGKASCGLGILYLSRASWCYMCLVCRCYQLCRYMLTYYSPHGYLLLLLRVSGVNPKELSRLSSMRYGRHCVSAREWPPRE
eukprot:sb/3468289/